MMMHELEGHFMNGQGILEIISGPMFSGKTEELIRRIRRVEFARQRSIVFKPEIDIRYSKDLLVSHSEQKIGSVPVPNAARVRTYLGSSAEPFQVVALDEVQFFDKDVIYLCEDLVSSGVRVIAAGLCEDYLGRPFGPMPDLLAHADVITKLWAVCMQCGAPASKSQRIAREGKKTEDNQVLVGAQSFYEARCRRCHIKAIVPLEHHTHQEAVDFAKADL